MKNKIYLQLAFLFQVHRRNISYYSNRDFEKFLGFSRVEGRQRRPWMLVIENKCDLNVAHWLHFRDSSSRKHSSNSFPWRPSSSFGGRRNTELLCQQHSWQQAPPYMHMSWCKYLCIPPEILKWQSVFDLAKFYICEINKEGFRSSWKTSKDNL